MMLQCLRSWRPSGNATAEPDTADSPEGGALGLSVAPGMQPRVSIALSTQRREGGGCAQVQEPPPVNSPQWLQW